MEISLALLPGPGFDLCMGSSTPSSKCCASFTSRMAVVSPSLSHNPAVWHIVGHLWGSEPLLSAPRRSHFSHLSSRCVQGGLATQDHLMGWAAILGRPTCTLGQEPQATEEQLTCVLNGSLNSFARAPVESQAQSLPGWQCSACPVLHMCRRVTCPPPQGKESAIFALGLSGCSDHPALKNLPCDRQASHQ